MKNYCNKCGNCCEAIFLSLSKKDIIKQSPIENGGDAAFIINNWTRISQATALKINPYLKLWTRKKEKSYFYKCNKFNPETRLCSIHKERPRVCAKFPLYGRKKLRLDEVLYSKDCGFNRDDLREIQK